MKKDKLIALLQSIEGNPDVLLYNGFVDDWTDITVHEDKHTLYKPCKQHYRMMVSLQHQDITQESLDALVKQYSPSWEFANRFYDEDDIKRRYNRKKDVVFLEAKERGKKVFGHRGDVRMDY